MFVIDAKHYRGRPRLRVTGGLLRPRSETLMVGRRARGELVDGVLKQTDLVRTALAHAGHGAVPVTGMLCFVDAEWPLRGGSFATRGVYVLWPKKISQHAFQSEQLGRDAIAEISRSLATRFKRA